MDRATFLQVLTNAHAVAMHNMMSVALSSDIGRRDGRIMARQHAHALEDVAHALNASGAEELAGDVSRLAANARAHAAEWGATSAEVTK